MLATMSGLHSLEVTYKSKIAMIRAVSRQSGVSTSLLLKLYYGQRKNPTIDIMDKLADAVAILEERRS